MGKENAPMKWLFKHLVVDDFRSALHFASVKLALAVAFVSGVAIQFWPYLVQVLPYMPAGKMRTALSVLSFIAIAAGAAGTRLWKQSPPNG
jgi:polyferredoxin